MKFLIIGGAGNVGHGIAQAIKQNPGNELTIIDPKINSTFEDVVYEQLEKILLNTDIIIFSTDVGKSELYEINQDIAVDNILHFNNCCNTISKINPNVPIWYVGGSWTKRKPNRFWIVDEDSPNKAMEESNAYERSKIQSENNASHISSMLSLKIRFVDYISIIPNLFPDFTLCRYSEQAILKSKIEYIDGDMGRPLLTSFIAGRMLLKIIEMDDPSKMFDVFLVPGVFIEFKTFAEIAKKVVDKRLKSDIILNPISSNQEYLRTTIKSKLFEYFDMDELKNEVLKSLDQNVVYFLGQMN